MGQLELPAEDDYEDHQRHHGRTSHEKQRTGGEQRGKEYGPGRRLADEGTDAPHPGVNPYSVQELNRSPQLLLTQLPSRNEFLGRQNGSAEPEAADGIQRRKINDGHKRGDT